MIVRRPAPLFGVALAFVFGTWGPHHFSVLLAYSLSGLSLIAWFGFPSTTIARGSFYTLVVLGAGFYTDLRSSLCAPDDLRLLSESKFQELSRWEGVLVSAPESRLDSTGTASWVEAVFRVDRWQPALASSFAPAQGLVAIRLTGTDATTWRYGDRLAWSGALRVPAAPRNPGQLDYRQVLAQRNIYYQARISSEKATLVERRQGWWGMDWALFARDWAYQKLRLGLENDPQTSALLAGMLFGYHQDISPELEEAFRVTGTYHIFAVSGQNVAVLLTVALLVLRLLGFLRWRWGWICVPLLLGYCFMSGSQPSAVRALAMVLLVLWAWHRQRPLCALNLWSRLAGFAHL
jgi:competence protein ComEC